MAILDGKPIVLIVVITNCQTRECDKVKLKSNSLSMTFKDLDLIECTQYADEIIPKTNLSKNYEKLFQIFNVDPIDLKTDYYQGAGLE